MDCAQCTKVLVSKLDGLSRCNIRRPLTATSTNLLALVRNRASRCQVPQQGLQPAVPGTEYTPWNDAGRLENERLRRLVPETPRRTSSFSTGPSTITRMRRIDALPIDAPGRVPSWPRQDMKLFNVMVHVLNDATRHAGHADILREQLNGRTGTTAQYEEAIDVAARDAYCAKVERAAEAADPASAPDRSIN